MLIVNLKYDISMWNLSLGVNIKPKELSLPVNQTIIGFSH